MGYFGDYHKELKKINILAANLVSIVIIVATTIVLGIPFFLLWKPELSLSLHQSFLLGFLCITGIIIHELIHGLFFGLYAKNGFKSIRFGVIWKKLTPFCHCKEPLKLKQYIIGLLMPGILLGIVPTIISLFNGNELLMLLGIIFTSAAAGDFMIAWLLRKEQASTFVQDHPSELGCYVYGKP